MEEQDAAAARALWPFKVLYVLHSCCQMMLMRFVTTYFVHIGLETALIGYLQALRPCASFVGELLIASVADHSGRFRATVLSFNAAGVALFLCLPQASSFLQLAIVYGLSMLGVSWMGLRDARVLATLESYGRGSEFGQVRKFAAVGWGASGLVTGQLQDWLGRYALFGAFATIECALMLLLVFVPMEPPAQRGERKAQGGGLWATVRTAEVGLFLANLFAYGFCASAVETYLFVYLLRDFHGASDTLAGCTLVVMTTSEVPVFQYADRVMGRGYAPVHAACHWVFALRCLLYAALPVRHPWLVLAIEPLHGVTFAAMWASAVDFGRKRAPAGCAARFQALVNGVYFQAAMGFGSLFWGHAMSYEGYRTAYRGDAALVVSWGVLWSLVMLRRAAASKQAAGGSALSASLLDSKMQGLEG